MNAQYFFRRIVALAAASLWPAVMTNAQNRSVAELVPIPAGAFMMGSDTGPADERPAHRVEVAAFSIDRTPVTNAQAAEFLNAKGAQGLNGEEWYQDDDNDARVHRKGDRWVADAGAENHPVLEFSWFGAREYCAWVGKRLPTEAEWEKAARGTDGRRYPWGDAPPDRTRAQVRRGMEWNGAGWKASCGRQPVWGPGSLGERVGVGQQPVPAVSVQSARRPGRSCLDRRTGHARRRPGFGCEPFDHDVPGTRTVARAPGRTSQHRIPLCAIDDRLAPPA